MPSVRMPSASDLVPPERPHAAVEVADRDLEEQPADQREHRVAEVAVQRRHRTRRDAALEPVAHHQVGARRAAPATNAADVVECVAVVGVGHQHEPAAGGLDAAAQRGAVAAPRIGDHPGALGPGDLPGSVVRAVVGDQHLADDAQRCSEARALRMQMASVSASLRHGIRMVSSRSGPLPPPPRVGGSWPAAGCPHRCGLLCPMSRRPIPRRPLPVRPMSRGASSR